MFRRVSLVIVLAFAMLGISPSASAASQVTTVQVAPVVQAKGSLTYNYPVYHYQVCKRQGHFGASFYNPWNPRSWYCYDVSFPFGVTFAGGLDINGWCKAKYKGSTAVLTGKSVWDWKCRKRVY